MARRVATASLVLGLAAAAWGGVTLLSQGSDGSIRGETTTTAMWIEGVDETPPGAVIVLVSGIALAFVGLVLASRATRST